MKKYSPSINIFSAIIVTIYLLAAKCEYISASFTPASYIIEESNIYSVELVRNINPISFDFISPVAAVPVGSTIKIIFPNDYSTISTKTNPPCSSPDTTATLTCTLFPSTNTIVVQGYYSTTDAAQISNVIINIESIQNPQKAGMTGNFEYYINKADSTIIDQSPSASYAGYSTGITFLGGEF